MHLTCSQGDADTGADVGAVGGDADLCVVRGDARGRLRARPALVAEQRAPPGVCGGESAGGVRRHGRRWVSPFDRYILCSAWTNWIVDAGSLASEV